MKKIFVLFNLLVLVAGCTTEPTRIKPVVFSDNVRLNNETKMVQVGDVVIEEGKYIIYSGIDLKESLQATRLFKQRVYIPPQILTAEYEDNKFVYYYGSNVVVIDEFGKEFHNSVGGIKVLKQPKEKEIEFQVFGFAPQYTYIKTTEPKLKYVNASKRSDNGFEKKIVFSGKRGELLLFKYSERDDSRHKKDITFDIEFDPSEEVLAIKGAEIRIISHTSTELQYKVLSGFSK